jgi:hypothetical protein
MLVFSAIIASAADMLSLLIVSLVVLQAAAPAAQLDGIEERTILEVVLAHPDTTRVFGPNRVEVTARTEPWKSHAVFDLPREHFEIATIGRRDQ